MRPPLNNFSWDVHEGSTLLLGPNAAGKSTVLKLAAGLLTPDSGSIELSGHSARSGHQAQYGYLPQESPIVKTLRVREQVEYAAWLTGMPKASTGEAVRDSLEATHLTARGDVRTSELSGGEARRLNLACAIVHRPPVLLLDEPTTGLDPLEKESLAAIIAHTSSRIVVVATHDAEFLLDACSRVVILHHGAVVDTFGADEDRDNWRARYRDATTTDGDR
ncbi:ABC transporter ATP-binding protein [Brachybacterium vulturis]|uniref:ABC transporter ATP-binding protein n=1 Tax=Brachybacterium vulturis TaxID=2017484 RepID=UPI003736C06B